MRTGSTSICAAALLSLTACAAAPQPAAVEVSPALPAAAAAPMPASPDLFKAPSDSVADDAAVPAGAVHVTVLDADGKPIARAPVTFEEVIVHERAAGLDVVSKDTAVADDAGVATLRKARVDPAHRYVVSVRRGDGTFGVTPFAFAPSAGKRVVLHAYETTRALVAVQTMAVLSVTAGGVEVEVLHVLYNIGRTAWMPTGVRVAFPPKISDFFVSDMGMPVRATDITERGFLLEGTVAPGGTELTYRFKVPREGRGPQRLVLGQLPRTAQARVVLDAGGAATLAVAGFPAAEAKAAKGTTVLMTELKAESRATALATLEVTFAGDPRCAARSHLSPASQPDPPITRPRERALPVPEGQREICERSGRTGSE